MPVKMVEKQLQQMLLPGQRAAVALSGGRDSVCLLHMVRGLAHQLSIELMAVHVHHGLRAEADEDEAFCRCPCQKWGIELIVERVNVPQRVQETGETVEEAARMLRYQVFEELVKSGQTDRILLAHHQQDQAETVLLHLLRGSGLTGLCGMKAQRLPYVRPMLEVLKAKIDGYIQEYHLPFVEDASNQDTVYRRNHIRHRLLPLLEQEYNPEIVTALSRMAELLQEEEAFLEEQMPQVPMEGQLSVSWLLQYPVNLQRRILRKWLRQNGLKTDVQQVHLQQLMELAQGATGRRISLPKGLTVQKSYDILVIRRSGLERDMKQLLQEDEPCTAVICAYDYIALGAIRYLSRCGMQVPEDMSVIGMDNISVSGYLSRSLSTIDSHAQEMSEIVCELMEKKLKNPQFRVNQQIMITGTLVLRDSVGACREMHEKAPDA